MSALICPLCCKQSFPTAWELVCHLQMRVTDLKCSRCKIRYGNLETFIEHLGDDSCQPQLSNLVHGDLAAEQGKAMGRYDRDRKENKRHYGENNREVSYYKIER